MVISIKEVIGSVRIGRWEKVLWVVGILSVFNLAGLVYIILRRRRIIQVENITSIIKSRNITLSTTFRIFQVVLLTI